MCWRIVHDSLVVKNYFFLTRTKHMGKFLFFLGPDRSTWGKNNCPMTCKQGHDCWTTTTILGGGEGDSPSYVSWKLSSKSIVRGTEAPFFCCVVVSSVHDIVHRLTWNHLLQRESVCDYMLYFILFFSFWVWSLTIETNTH
jgi:hypothetical protein